MFLIPIPASGRPPSTDFNGDGFDDLAVGVPYENFGSVENSGAVNVLLGTVDGISTDSTYNHYWSQEVEGVPGDSERNDYFGRALAAGNFNGDDYDDLAIGISGEGDQSGATMGIVQVLYGTGKSLSSAGSQVWHQNVLGISDRSEQGDAFGKVLTAGDSDGDGYDDLAIGVPSEDHSGKRNAGAVNIIYGSSTGLTAVNSQFWHQDIPGIRGAAERGDFFGSALTAGDFDGDGYDDLAVGVKGEDVRGHRNAGAVNVLYGSNDGLSAAGDQMWHQDVAGVPGACERNDSFGRSLTSGDFNDDGYDDLAIGVPYEDTRKNSSSPERRDMGAVQILYGSGNRLTSSGTEFFHPLQGWFLLSLNSPRPTTAGSFGFSLAAGDFDSDDSDDLAIGVPFWNSEQDSKKGRVWVLFGHPDHGIWYHGRYLSWPQTTGHSWVGYSLSTGDFNADNFDDLAIGTPKDDSSLVTNSGAVQILWGNPGGIDYTDKQDVHQDNINVGGACEGGDFFGWSLVQP